MPQSHTYPSITKIFKTYGCFIVFSFWGLFIIPGSATAQTITREALLNISGEVKMPLTMAVATLDTMKKTSIVVKDKAGNEHTYSGVELFAVLRKAGVTLGEELKGKNLAKYIFIEASDGYQVVFSLAETDPSFSQRKIILATRKDDALLPANEGPFHLIIDGEMRQSRFIKQVISMKIKYAN